MSPLSHSNCLLLIGNSAQKAELVAFAQARQLTAGADFKYVFTIIHVHGTLYKERGLINSGRKSAKYGQEILEPLDTVWAPKWVAVIHRQENKKGDAIIAFRDWKVDREAKQAGLMGAPTALIAALFPCPLAKWHPQYISQEQGWFKAEKGSFQLNGWWKFADGRIAILESLAPTFVRQFHEGTHSG
jgi:hypothetical protein